MEGYGRLIRTLRNISGLSQKAFAERMGVSQQAYAKLERDNSNPREETINKLSEAFKVPSSLFLMYWSAHDIKDFERMVMSHYAIPSFLDLEYIKDRETLDFIANSLYENYLNKKNVNTDLRQLSSSDSISTSILNPIKNIKGIQKAGSPYVFAMYLLYDIFGYNTDMYEELTNEEKRDFYQDEKNLLRKYTDIVIEKRQDKILYAASPDPVPDPPSTEEA